jgi:radical SAM superfamily enzyme YgiQ (UPF0313 family)
MLRDVGLTSVTVGIETPSRETLVKYKRAPVKDDKQSQFVALCRNLGIRVVAGFMIGFPEDTRQTVRAVLRYAKQVDPFVANFNVCTPYPGTGFIEEIEPLIASRDWSRYDVYTPNLKYEHLTSEAVTELHQECFRQYYFRWKYVGDNWQFFFPRLHRVVSALAWQRPPESAWVLEAGGAKKTDRGRSPVVAGGNALKIIDAPDKGGSACGATVEVDEPRRPRKSA